MGFAVLFTGIVAPRRPRLDGGPADLRPARGGGPAGFGDRSSPHWLDPRRRLLRHGLHAGVAASVARQPAAAAGRGGVVAPRLADSRATGHGTHARLCRRHLRAVPAPPAQFSGTSYPRRVRQRVRSRFPSWWGAWNGWRGSSAMIRDEVQVDRPGAGNACVASRWRGRSTRRRLICDAAGHPVRDPGTASQRSGSPPGGSTT